MKNLTKVQRALLKNVVQEPADPRDISFLDIFKAFILYGSFVYTVIDLVYKYSQN